MGPTSHTVDPSDDDPSAEVARAKAALRLLGAPARDSAARVAMASLGAAVAGAAFVRSPWFRHRTLHLARHALVAGARIAAFRFVASRARRRS
ncbi:MAG: hypothetical protein U0575_13305 [Phycisphaerales bacterium]